MLQGDRSTLKEYDPISNSIRSKMWNEVLLAFADLIIYLPFQIIDEVTGEVELKFLSSENYNRENDKIATLNEYLAELYIPGWRRSLKDPTLAFDCEYMPI